ncbi:DUF402 domain-containing protein [Candidatus Entotheonella palauensis]|uniref:DUF402 domain-containing protein n=1 Tax=Candidatus Entotheonella palauensis TaxID=93172 RepID=UPI0015C4A37C|nr:DUF402 domain-containing protein [Candidatus Entotheonella palauensis]
MESTFIPPLFRPGDSVLYRGLDERRRVVSVLPVRVVRDDSNLVVLWLPLGTPSIKPELLHHTPGSPRRWVDSNWYLTHSTWQWAELLVLIRPGEHRATWVRWSAERDFQGWVVNMQSPLVRTRLGFDHWDHQLDIIVNPDRSWRWKDEDELELAVELGRMTREQAGAVRDEGLIAVEQIEQNRSPFSDGWEHWTPEPTWPLPDLVEDWRDVSMYQSLHRAGFGSHVRRR